VGLEDDSTHRRTLGEAAGEVSDDGPYDVAMATATASTTPNPNAMKFTLDVTLPDMVNATSREAATGQPLAEALFAIDGVVGVFATGDFVTVSKSPAAEWDTLTPAVTDVLRAQL